MIDADGKSCTLCGIYQPNVCFSFRLGKRNTRCKTCLSLKHKQWREEKGIEYSRDKKYKQAYGLSLDNVRTMFIAQSGKCKLCQIDMELEEGLKANMAVVDHCHTTGKVRGLLCNQCNQALGLFKDNQQALLRAVEYLKGDL